MCIKSKKKYISVSKLFDFHFKYYAGIMLVLILLATVLSDSSCWFGFHFFVY